GGDASERKRTLEIGWIAFCFEASTRTSVRASSVASPDTPRRLRRAGGGVTGRPVVASAARIAVSAPARIDSGQTARPPATRNEPPGWPRRTILSMRRARSKTCTSPFPPLPEPCVHVAKPARASGWRHGLGQNPPDGACAAPPIRRSRPERESHDHVVKSSKLESEWYSFQTSQRPSKA